MPISGDGGDGGWGEGGSVQLWLVIKMDFRKQMQKNAGPKVRDSTHLLSISQLREGARLWL